MKSLSRYLVVSVLLLSAVTLASGALARGGHRGGRGGGAGAGGASLCSSAALLDLSLSNVDIMIKTSGNQMAALEELKKVAKENSDDISRVCAGENPMSLPAKMAAAEKRLDATLNGARKLKPVAEKFYATLNDEQKAQVNTLVDWPGL
jgi:LTXXQ motif family protein